MTTAAKEELHVFSLAAFRLFGEKPHPGYQLPTAVPHPGIDPVNSNTATGPVDSLYDFRGMPRYWNMYSYVANNPLAYVDPSGLTTCDANGNNCYDSVTVNSGDDGGGNYCDNFPQLCFSLFGPGQTGPSGGGNQPNPSVIFRVTATAQSPTQSQGTFGACMEAHASDFSVAGFVDNGFAASGHPGFQPLNNFLGSAAFGNNITGAWFAVFGNSKQSTSNALTTAANQGLIGNVSVVTGLGTNLTAGARGSSLMSLNLAGKPGVGAQVLARSAGVRSALKKVAAFGKATTIIDAGLTLGEAIDCATGAIK